MSTTHQAKLVFAIKITQKHFSNHPAADNILYHYCEYDDSYWAYFNVVKA